MASLAHNLNVRRNSIHDCWAGVTIYWLGDAAHMRSHSDHNPDSTGVVHALDVMFSVGPKATSVVNWCLAHPDDLEYVIHNRKIYSRSYGFAPRVYSGVDPHTNHVHISGRHGSSHASSYTGNGYNLTAEKMTPVGTPCGTVTPTPVPPHTAYDIGAYPGTELKKGSTGPNVAKIQKKLNLNGYPLVADGDFGDKTDAAVRKLQTASKLTVDGIVGPKTWAAIGRLPK